MAAGFVFVAALALVACGGDSKKADSDPIGESEAKEAADRYFLTSLGLFTGDTEPQEFIDIFAPECRADADLSTLAFAILFIQGFAPDLKDVEVEAVDVGGVNLEQTDEGALVTPQDANGLRVKVDGEFVPASEFFSEVGFDDAEEDTAEPLLLVRRDGVIYLGDCSELSSFAGDDEGFSLDPEETPQGSTGVVIPNASGSSGSSGSSGATSSRSAPIRLGVSAVVEDLWEVTVVQVIPDAWSLIEAEYEFNDAPAVDERMIMIMVRMENVSNEDKPESVSGFEFNITGSRNQLYSQYDGEHDCGIIPDSLTADLFPGGETEGNVCFRVKKDETDFILVWDSFFDDLTYFALE